MVKGGTIVVIVIVVVLSVLGGVFGYSYTQIQVELNDVDFHSIDWANLSFSDILKLGLNAFSGNWLSAAFDLIQGINLTLFLDLTNNGFLPVYIPDLSYDLIVNGVSVGNGFTSIDTTINPRQTITLPVLQNFQKSSLTPAIGNIVNDGGVIDLKVRGTAYFQIFGLSVPIPFESSKQISIIDEVKNYLQSKTSVDEKQVISEQSQTGLTESTNSNTQDNMHVHGKILVKIFGDNFDFSAPAYQIKSSLIHFEDQDGLTVHRHATGVTLGYLFDTLSLSLDDQCFTFQDGREFCTNDDYSLKFYINEELIKNIKDYEIKDGDRILISYGGEALHEINQQLTELNNQ